MKSRTATQALDAERSVPPQALDAERCVLASCLLAPDTLDELRGILSPSDFYEVNGPNRKLYGHMLAMRADGLPLDVPLLTTRIKDAGDYDEVNATFIAEIATATATPANAEYYARQVLDASVKRQQFSVAHEALDELSNGRAGSDILRGTISRLEAIQHAQDRHGQMFEVHSPAELVAMDLTTNFFIEGVMAQGQNGLGGGIYKTLKTTICADAAISVTTGTPFLNKFDVPLAANVLFMSAESGLRKLTETCQRISAARGIDFADNRKLFIAPNVPRLGHAIDEDMLRRTITGYEIELVFVDPAYRALAGIGNDASNVFRVGELLSSLDSISEDTGATIYLVHHCGKHSADGEAPELKDVAFAGFAEWARQWLLLAPRRAWNPDTGEHSLWLAYGGSEGHAGCWGLDVCEGTIRDLRGQRWEVSVLTRDEVRQTESERRKVEKQQRQVERNEHAQQAIVEALKGIRGRRETKRQIRDRSGLNAQLFNTAFAELLNAGTLTECDIQKNGRTYEAFTFSNK